MKKIFARVLRYVFWSMLWFRYKIKVKGLENLTKEQLNRPGGTLVLPNHTTILVDPLAAAIAVWLQLPVRPLIVEYMYNMPGVYTLMRFLNALPVPNFNTATNSIKKKRNDKVLAQLIHDLKNGDNFLIYPSGRIKRTGVECVGGASTIYNILQEAPESNIVLMRITGLWGSSFSRALTGQTPPLFPMMLRGIKYVLSNLLFFTPRRSVTIEVMVAPENFPRNGTKLEINNYLDAWYNNYPTGVDSITGGEPLTLVSYSMWHKKFPVIESDITASDGVINLEAIPEDIKDMVIAKIAEMTNNTMQAIYPEMNLSTDLGLDSLDIAEVILFLQDQFDVQGIPVDEVDTVAKVMALAAKQVVCEAEVESGSTYKPIWNNVSREKIRVQLFEGNSIAEVFFRCCDFHKNSPACVDENAGILTYSQFKMRTLLLAESIRKLPGEYIGILLPASVAAYAVVLACEIVKKTPLMINWTVGPQHLETVIEKTGVKNIFTSWSFIERLNNVELEGIDECLIMLEDLRKTFTLADKIKAFLRSKYSAKRLLNLFNLNNSSEDDKAVLLFTSGTENTPKGVPLSQKNILSNLRAALDLAEIYSNDVMLGILPPFHAFGFTVSGLLPLLCGMRVAYSADPTDGKKLVRALQLWGATMMCGAPTFIKGMLKVANAEQIKTLRMLITGAEKAPPELYEMMRQLGKENALFEGYGITECSPILCLNCPSFPSRGVGKALPGVEMLMVHPENHKPLEKFGEQGLLLVRGPNIFKGYLNADVASPFLKVNDILWYNTGDLGVLDEEGYLFLTGRMKRFVKIGGEMISLSAIETALLQMARRYNWPIDEEGQSLAICAQEQAGEKTKLFLFAKFSTNIDAVNKALREAGFSNLVKISTVNTLEQIPIMGTGKVNYRKLEAAIQPIGV